MKLIEAKHLSFSYDGKNDVVNDVSFVIESGTYTSIIGHNGSGKSTIAKLLMGLLSTKEGELIAFDLAYNRKNIHEIRSHIGIVFQNPDNQFIGSTVRDDIAFGLENRLVPQKDMQGIIDEFAAKVNMLDFLDKEPENLSGGQKQRVAIAGILAMSPDLIILDEATSMLDPRGKNEIRKTIALLREENPNLAVVSITHDIEEAFISDRVIVVNKGYVVFDENPNELIKHADELIKMGLNVPFEYRLKKLLEENGLEKVEADLK
jgi:energy-coupling factor transport system ATP-binding protein